MLTTESSSRHDDLDQKSTLELLQGMNQEDKTVPLAIEQELASIQALIDAAYVKMLNGGRSIIT